MKAQMQSVAIAILFFAVLFGLYVWTSSSDQSRSAKAATIGVDAYIYGYPLVVMDAARQAALTPKEAGQAAIINTFQHFREQTPSVGVHSVSPSIDTLYSSARLDLSTGPLLLHIPETTGRYYFIEMFDGWGNLFANPGTRTTGSQAADFVIVGPQWEGIISLDNPQLKSSTNMVWITLRLELFGTDDSATAQALQDQFSLSPLGSSTVSPPTFIASVRPSPPSASLVSNMKARSYFNALEKLLTTNPPSAADAPLLERIATVEIFPDREPEKLTRDPAIERGLEQAVGIAQEKIKAAVPSTYKKVNGWDVFNTEIGTYGTDYLLRASVAASDLGTPLLQDAVYPSTGVDSEGMALSGAHRYTIHFTKEGLPPVNAFWSLTMYNVDHAFVENPIHRYCLQSHQTLHYNADGSLDIIIQKDEPQEKNVNWLPCPEGDFNLIMRMYWPKPEVFDGVWSLPAVVRAQ